MSNLNTESLVIAYADYPVPSVLEVLASFLVALGLIRLIVVRAIYEDADSGDRPSIVVEIGLGSHFLARPVLRRIW